MKKKVLLTLLAIGGVISALKLEAMYYQKQIERLEMERASMFIENKITYADLDVCKAKLIKATNNFKN